MSTIYCRPSFVSGAPILSVTTSSAPELLQCTPFEALGLQQAFEVKVSSNALMMMVSILEYNHDIQ